MPTEPQTRRSPAPTGLRSFEDRSPNSHSILPAQPTTLADLVNVLDGEAVTTTAAIAEGTDVEHASVIRLVRTYLDELQQFGGVRFQIDTLATKGGPQQREVGYLNERQAVLLLSLMRNNEIVVRFKTRLVRAFYALAQRAQQAEMPTVPQSLPEALRLAADLAERVDHQVKVIAAQAPDVEFVDRFVRARDSYSLREAAKVVSIPEREFLGQLIADGVLFRMQGDRLMPKAEYQHRGLFRVRAGEAHGKAYAQTRFTARGIEWVAKRYGSGPEAGHG